MAAAGWTEGEVELSDGVQEGECAGLPEPGDARLCSPTTPPGAVIVPSAQVLMDILGVGAGGGRMRRSTESPGLPSSDELIWQHGLETRRHLIFGGTQIPPCSWEADHGDPRAILDGHPPPAAPAEPQPALCRPVVGQRRIRLGTPGSKPRGGSDSHRRGAPGFRIRA